MIAPLTEIEQHLVGAVVLSAMQGRDLLAEIEGGSLLSCLHTAGVRDVFKLCLDLHGAGEPIGLENLVAAARREQLTVGGADLATWAAAAADWSEQALPSLAFSYAQQLRAHHARHEVARVARVLVHEAVAETRPVSDWLPPYLTQFASVLEIGARRQSFSEQVVDTLSELEAVADGRRPRYVATGIGSLDRRFGGLPLGSLTVVAGRPGMGKSALALSWVSAMLASGTPVGLASPEMSRQQVITRILAMRAAVPLWRCVQGATSQSERVRLAVAAEQLSGQPFELDDETVLWPAIVGLVERWVTRGVRAVIVDYLGLVHGSDPKVPRWQEVGLMTRSAVQLAKRHQIAVVLLVQLTRDAARDHGKPPELWQLRESGATEQDGAVVIFVHRPAYYSDTAPAHLAELHLRKNRHGPTGSVKVHWDGERAMFRDTGDGWE